MYTLEPAKASRLGGRTMVVPSPREIQETIRAIPEGTTQTLLELRSVLAQASGAEIACPRAMTAGWFLVAQAAEEDRAEGSAEIAPWWRVTRNHKPDPRLPSGPDHQRALLAAEGVRI